MSADLKGAVDRLRSLSPKLNVAIDQAARLVGSVEAFLEEECRVGVTAYHVITTESDDEENWALYNSLLIGYDRVGGRHRIVVKRHETDGNGDMQDDIRPWGETARDDKLITFEGLQNLLQDLADVVAQTVDQTHATIDAVSDALGSSALPESQTRKSDLQPVAARG